MIESGSSPYENQEGDIVPRDNVDPIFPDTDTADAVRIAREMMEDDAVEQQEKEDYGVSYHDVLEVLKGGEVIGYVNTTTEQGAKYRKSLPEFMATDVFDMVNRGQLTRDGYRILCEKFLPSLKPKNGIYESGGKNYRDYLSAAANDPLEHNQPAKL